MVRVGDMVEIVMRQSSEGSKGVMAIGWYEMPRNRTWMRKRITFHFFKVPINHYVITVLERRYSRKTHINYRYTNTFAFS